MTTWKELQPYYHGVLRAIFEVLMEDCFHPGYVTRRNKKGFLAPPYYWKLHARDPNRYPLSECLRFIAQLLKRNYLVTSMNAFNKRAGVDWLSGPDMTRLSGFVYSICFYLDAVLYSKEGEEDPCVKPRFVAYNA